MLIRVLKLKLKVPIKIGFKLAVPIEGLLTLYILGFSSRCDTGSMHDLLLTWASGESKSESRRAKKELEQPYAISVQSNWCVKAT